MDDLLSQDWTAKPNGLPQQQPSRSTASSPFTSNPTLRPAFAQAILTPQISRPNSGFGAGVAPSPPKSGTPANDSFSNLLPSITGKFQSSVSLQDKQRQLQEERQRQLHDQQRRQQQEAHLWDRIGTNGSARATAKVSQPNAVGAEDEDDILAAFNSTAKVDRSSHFPPPPAHSGSSSRLGTPAPQLSPALNGTAGSSRAAEMEDDDPFGLGSMPEPASKAPIAQTQSPVPDDDDFLGDLGKPVQPRPPTKVTQKEETVSGGRNMPNRQQPGPFDRQVAELVDMGFPADTARLALQETSGNLQSAVSWLLNQAHAEAQAKAKGQSISHSMSPSRQPARTKQSGAAQPSRMQPGSRGGSQARWDESVSERDASQYASEMGSAFLKSANNLWKAGRKQVQKAVADFQQEGGDPNQPKWMRDTSADSRHSVPTPKSSAMEPRPETKPAQASNANMTDEAMLLEGGGGRPERSMKPAARFVHESQTLSPMRGRSPAQVLPERTATPERLPPRQTPAQQAPNKITRDQVEAQASQAYVSSARRRKPAAESPAPAIAQPEVDLFSPAPPSAPTASARTASSGTVSAPPKPTASRGGVPVRTLPSISPTALSQSSQLRNTGTEAFKRGDYASAHTSYTSALALIPSNHPMQIIILSNRALTAIKTGEPRQAIADADIALAIIGPSRGDGEHIDVGSEGQKDMKEFYGKALSRKAEALEALEKWSDAASVWQTAVSAGVGGIVAVRGRDRCVKAANPAAAKAAASSAPVSRARSAATPAPNRRPAPASTQPSGASREAVSKLRAANAAAEKLDDEKFALSDSVSARIEAWKKGGKGDNLRALLASLETVLWDGSGWKKVGMAELVLPNKVKIAYMRAVAKCHPDKIPQNATTEQKMISANVFSTLNEAWDKFKTDNGL